MASLPAELWHQIAGEVYGTGDMPTILAICRSSQLLRDQTNPWLYQHLTFSMGKPHEIIGFVSGLNHPNAYVLSLNILPRDRVADSLPSGTLEHLVSSLPSLRTFNWRCNLPVEHSVLELVNTRQNSRLHHNPGNALGSRPLPNALWTNLKLGTLSLSFEWSHQTRDGNPNFQLGQAVMLNAPGLQHLSVEIRYPNERNYSLNSREAFRFTTNRMLPPIRTLALHGYSVGLGRHDELVHRLQVSFLRDLTLKIGPHSSFYLFLETLMRDRNLCLKVLDIYYRGWGGSLMHTESQVSLRRFLQSFKGLKKLAMRGSEALPFSPVVDAISWHGDTLEVLVLYDPDGTPPTWQSFAQPLRVTVEVVQQLCVACTSLKTLVLYLHFGTDVALQQSFQQFQALEKLIIYSPLRSGPKEYLEPRVDDAYVRNLAMQIRSPLLREVTLYIGKDTPRTSPEYIRQMKWENDNRRVWHIEYPQDDNTYAGIKVWELVQ